MECFLHTETAAWLGVPTKKLSASKQVKNIDGTVNISGAIKEAYLTSLNGEERILKFYLAKKENKEVILGYPFLKALNPKINWLNASTQGSVSAFLPQKKNLSCTPEWIRSIPEWEDGNNLWWRPTVAKTTVAQQLAERAHSKDKKTWDEIAPKTYHQYVKVFSEQAFE
ncbi:hypothetical protein BC827DRAFT_1293006 [Russula dissimulans]|nr:hypothetical protein BC827DRAFT_1293006 [Russula dissimulans]